MTFPVHGSPGTHCGPGKVSFHRAQPQNSLPPAEPLFVHCPERQSDTAGKKRHSTILLIRPAKPPGIARLWEWLRYYRKGACCFFPEGGRNRIESDLPWF